MKIFKIIGAAVLALLIGCAGFLIYESMSFKGMVRQAKEIYAGDFDFSLEYSADLLALAGNTEESDSLSILTETFDAGRLTGEKSGDVMTGLFYEEGSETPLTNFYVDSDLSLSFGSRQVCEYYLTKLEEATGLPLSKAAGMAPDGYMTLSQICKLNHREIPDYKTYIGAGASFLDHAVLILPAKAPADSNMSLDTFKFYRIVPVSAQKLTIGFAKDGETEVIYVRADADIVNGKRADGELILYLTPDENEEITVPEAVSDKTIENLQTVLSLLGL